MRRNDAGRERTMTFVNQQQHMYQRPMTGAAEQLSDMTSTPCTGVLANHFVARWTNCYPGTLLTVRVWHEREPGDCRVQVGSGAGCRVKRDYRGCG